MIFTVKYQNRAIGEFEIAADWYRQKSESASANFQVAVSEKIALIRMAPAQYKQTYKQYHEAVVKKYPFSIVYLINEQEQIVIITSIYNHKRQPKKKFSK